MQINNRNIPSTQQPMHVENGTEQLSKTAFVHRVRIKMKRKAAKDNSENGQANLLTKKRKSCPVNRLVLHEIVLNIPNIFKRQSPNNIVEWELDFNNNYVERTAQTAPPVITSVDSSTQTPNWSDDDSAKSEIEDLRARLRALKESK
jgi:hypothetical protein